MDSLRGRVLVYSWLILSGSLSTEEAAVIRIRPFPRRPAAAGNSRPPSKSSLTLVMLYANAHRALLGGDACYIHLTLTVSIYLATTSTILTLIQSLHA